MPSSYQSRAHARSRLLTEASASNARSYIVLTGSDRSSTRYKPKAGKNPMPRPCRSVLCEIRPCKPSIALGEQGISMQKSSPRKYPATPFCCTDASLSNLPTSSRNRSPASSPCHSLNSLKCSMSMAIRQYERFGWAARASATARKKLLRACTSRSKNRSAENRAPLNQACRFCGSRIYGNRPHRVHSISLTSVSTQL